LYPRSNIAIYIRIHLIPQEKASAYFRAKKKQLIKRHHVGVGGLLRILEMTSRRRA